jgi:L-histidine N-alpha-methyltransferase
MRYNVTPLTPALRVDTAFEDDVLEGLGEPQKRLSSRWLYDHRGSELFEEITQLDEYYPTRTETRLLTELAPQLAAESGLVHSLIELGSGSSRKTRVLLAALRSLRRYIPVDISDEFLQEAARQLEKDFPGLSVQPVVADFTGPFELPAMPGGNGPDTASSGAAGNLGFFPGSTLGNFTPKASIELLGHLGRVLGSHSRLLVGIDTTQDPALLIPAYDDASGVTAEFNLNLLDRINRELGGDFDRREFRHLVRYDPMRSRMEMHLVSQRAQVVRVSGCEFQFAAGETIHTENCYKYSPSGFVRMANAGGWRCKRSWHADGKTGFAVYLLAHEGK